MNCDELIPNFEAKAEKALREAFYKAISEEDGENIKSLLCREVKFLIFKLVGLPQIAELKFWHLWEFRKSEKIVVAICGTPANAKKS